MTFNRAEDNDNIVAQANLSLDCETATLKDEIILNKVRTGDDVEHGARRSREERSDHYAFCPLSHPEAASVSITRLSHGILCTL